MKINGCDVSANPAVGSDHPQATLVCTLAPTFKRPLSSGLTVDFGSGV